VKSKDDPRKIVTRHDNCWFISCKQNTMSFIWPYLSESGHIIGQSVT